MQLLEKDRREWERRLEIDRRSFELRMDEDAKRHQLDIFTKSQETQTKMLQIAGGQRNLALISLVAGLVLAITVPLAVIAMVRLW